jgi:hypothetical protein
MENILQTAITEAEIVAPPPPPSACCAKKIQSLKQPIIGMYQYAQSAHATICYVITQPLATL